MAKALDWGILEGSVGPRVRLLRNALSARSIAVSAPHGLPTGSLTVLALIAANPGSSQTALASRAGLNKSALVGIVDQLEQRGLVERDRAASDRRRYQVSVTAEGETAMQALFAAVDRQEQDLRVALGKRDTIELLALLDKAVAALG
jgi:DNA-binding MarR family transcriptional regulator